MYISFSLLVQIVTTLIMSMDYLCETLSNRILILINFTEDITTKTLRKHAYSNILKILPQKNENFQINNPDIFHISAQNIDCGYSLEPLCEAVLTSTHNLCF